MHKVKITPGRAHQREEKEKHLADTESVGRLQKRMFFVIRRNTQFVDIDFIPVDWNFLDQRIGGALELVPHD